MQLTSLSEPRGKAILATVVLASGMIGLMGRSISLAIPAMQESLAADLSQMQWVINSFGLTLAVLLLISGSFSDHLGHKRMFSFGVIVFIAGSILSATATNVWLLVAWQVLLGLGAVMLLPNCLSILNIAFPERERGKVIGLWAGLSGGFGVSGFVLGGYVIQTFGWPGLFVINIPLGVAALLMAVKFFPSSEHRSDGSIDWIGALWLAVFLVALSYLLISGQGIGWTSAAIVSAIVVALLSFALFVRRQRQAKAPLVPKNLFESRMVVGANLMTLFLYFSLNGVYIFFVIYLQQALGFSPLLAGLGMLTPSLLVTLFAGFGGSIADKVGMRLPLIIGPLLTTAGIILLAIAGPDAIFLTAFFPGLILFGLGMVVFVSPITKAALQVDAKHSGAASGVNNAVARVSGLLAVAILGTVMSIVFTSALAGNLEDTELSTEQQTEIMADSDKVGATGIPPSFTDEETTAAQQAIQAALVVAFRAAMVISAACALISSAIALFTINNPRVVLASGSAVKDE